MDHYGRLAVVDRLGQVLDDGFPAGSWIVEEEDDKSYLSAKPFLAHSWDRSSRERDGQRRLLLNGLGEDRLQALVVVKAPAGTPEDFIGLGSSAWARG